MTTIQTDTTCEHICSSDCRREGCNCSCGEFHKNYESKHHWRNGLRFYLEGGCVVIEQEDPVTKELGEVARIPLIEWRSITAIVSKSV